MWLALAMILVPSSQESGFALVELFTSQGCSSCPPAEVYANELARRARDQGRPIHVVVFHVDYWDRLGWKDPFASPEYSARQRAYARNFNGNPFTPQMVVNGLSSAVGSRRDQVQPLIQTALANPVQTRIKANVDGGMVRISVNGKVPPGSDLVIAGLQSGFVTKVERGENRNRSLESNRVVTWFSVIPAKPEDRIEVPHPDQNDQTAELIVFLQQADQGRIMAVTEIPLG